MGKAHRSPLLGYNHNVSHLGHVFHVQTEDSGPLTPRLFTHLFYEGTILVSRKVEYEAMLPDDQVRTLMQTQHRTVIKDMVAGGFNERIVTFFRARGVSVALPASVPPPPPSPTAGAAAAISPNSAPAPTPAPAPTAALAPAMAPGTAVPAEAVPAHVPRRATRPIESQRTRKSAPVPIAVRPPDPRRPPFVRSAAPTVANTASADGVVMQRSVLVGGSNSPDARPRIRPPVPYIVAGGTHPVRPAPADSSVDPVAPSPDSQHEPPSNAPLSAVSDGPARPAGVFGSPARDDKSLDEVILEYLAEDGD